ncbi:copper/iron-regulated glutamine amidotransferase [Bisporella sp. PMI_857]|nr:copper/iron-regulated glutamine amidotransferase [Bisporella sp. PMI_857]
MLNIAVLVNHPPSAHFWTEIQQAFTDIFSKVTKLDFFDPIEKEEYPDPTEYDLIILSGGKSDASASDPWILKMLDFVRTTAKETPKTKMLGICWGHQILLRAFGGQVAPVPNGPVAGLVRVRLTEEGKRFFPFAAEKGSYIATQFHVREVAKATDDFVLLAENNEAFVSKSNTMLSFQAHPEIMGKFAKDLIWDDDITYTEGKSKEEIGEMRATINDPQDGVELLRRVIEWVDEK